MRPKELERSFTMSRRLGAKRPHGFSRLGPGGVTCQYCGEGKNHALHTAWTDKMSQRLLRMEHPDMTREDLLKIVDAIPEPCRGALLLHKRDGLTIPEVAERLDVTHDTALTYLAQATAYARRAMFPVKP